MVSTATVPPAASGYLLFWVSGSLRLPRMGAGGGSASGPETSSGSSGAGGRGDSGERPARARVSHHVISKQHCLLGTDDLGGWALQAWSVAPGRAARGNGDGWHCCGGAAARLERLPMLHCYSGLLATLALLSAGLLFPFPLPATTMAVSGITGKCARLVRTPVPVAAPAARIPYLQGYQA